MLIPFDDYPVHQTAAPLAQAGSGHPDQYDRFWFNGFRDDLMFAVAFCTYPNRELMEGAFSVLRDGRQTSVFASGRMNPDPIDTRMGPIAVEIIEPMRVNRVVVDSLEHGIRADLTYTADTVAIEEPRQTQIAGNRLVMDATRATQWGTWTGTIEVEGETIDLGEGVRGTKDRSWGTRVTGRPHGAPMRPQGFTFFWAPIHFDDECFHYITFERQDGSAWLNHAAVVPKADAAGTGQSVASMTGAHEFTWTPGTRRVASATITAAGPSGEQVEVELEPVATFQMKGIGYGHPTWGHGTWHGESESHGESWVVADLDPLAYENVHVQQLVRATWGDRTGLGVLEQIAVGPLPKYGLTGFLDGARVLERTTA
ncbi:hypothetical protein [Microbacterium thalassium]|uniref:Uncharacterized protein n=1 Tax=Microbacterium thalassium TaxID=362649 RepID=A0A7X0FN30_9MICO|nr:hypothetical protein [Microbacterium thalassium]MBB6390518.1 hypothetical protein [Microbacterium thalassium]GLK25629.1 hypothetical protein GCM10017607_29480 [Microbacterium thalassium]